MGLVTNALKSVGKEFLANKVADILDVGKDKDTPTETAQNDIPVDLSETTSMEDTYEPTVSDADENDPGIVELENYELEPIEDLEDKRNNLEDFYNTWGDLDMFKQNLKSQQDYEQPLDDSATPITVDSNDSSAIPNTDSEPETVSQESAQDSTLPQESASISGNTTAPESIAPLSVPENDIDKQVEEVIENNPTTAEQVAEDVSGEDSPIETEAEQLNDSNPNNDEVADEAVEQTPVNEKQEILDKLDNPGSSFINVPEDTEPLVSGYRREGDKLLDEYGNEIPDYESIDTEGGVLLHRDEDFAGPDEYVDEATGEIKSLDERQFPALNQQDYHKDLSLNGGRDIETTDDLAYTVEGESDFEPTIYKIEDLDREIKEAEQMPVTNAEEAKEKQNKLRALRLKLKEVQTATGHGSNISSTDPTTDNSTQTTGGRVSPRAGIGNIGGGAAGHGSMASTRPTKTVGDSHNSIASKAPLPHALEDNQGRVVSVNGKATTAPSSNNNGAFRSGSFGLMSKAKSNLKSIPSKAPVSSGPEHMGSFMAGGDLNLEDGKQILLERLKQLLAQLTDKEKKELGIPSALALNELDGYTLQDLIDKVEEHLGDK